MIKKTVVTRSTTLMDILAFFAVCIGGIGLGLSMILKGNIGGICQNIANIIGWIVLGILSFKYILPKRRIWIWVVWTIAFVLIIVSIIVPAL